MQISPRLESLGLRSGRLQLKHIGTTVRFHMEFSESFFYFILFYIILSSAGADPMMNFSYRCMMQNK
jgi:hypothetical protein